MSVAEQGRGDPAQESTIDFAEDTAEPVAEDEIVITPIQPIEEVIVLVPALDEESGIGLVLDRIPFEAIEDLRCEVSVLVVDGESVDATREIAQIKGAHVFIQSGRGKGNGVRQAFAHILKYRAQFGVTPHRQYVIMLDADGTYPPEDIPRMVAALREGADVVMGSRFLGHIQDGAMTTLNKTGNRLLSLLAQALFGVRVTDVCTGMWGFSEDFLEECDLQAKGFELEAEMFATAALSGAQITEVPIEYSPRLGKPKMVPLRTGVQIAKCLVQKRARAYRNRLARRKVRTMQAQGFRHADLYLDP